MHIDILAFTKKLPSFFLWVLPHLSWKETLPRTQGHQGKNQMVGEMSNNGQNEKSTLQGCNKGQRTAIWAPWVSTWDCLWKPGSRQEKANQETKKKQENCPRKCAPSATAQKCPWQWPPHEGIHSQPCLHLGLAMWPILTNGIRNYECPFLIGKEKVCILHSLFFPAGHRKQHVPQEWGSPDEPNLGPWIPKWGKAACIARNINNNNALTALKPLTSGSLFFLTAASTATTNTRLGWVLLPESSLTQQRFVTAEDVREGTEACLRLQTLPRAV